uniref:CCHC-type domain-containing protein n=1 Tax=Maylandia zebra TaxID=106582 RepID=A0A3P9DTE7_9CICH
MRKLTITGKVLVIKSEVVPKLLYLGYVFPMPQVFRIKPEEIYCLQQSTASKHYDVTLCTGECAEEVRRRFHGEENEELKKYTVTPLYRNDYRILTIHMYNPWVSEETIKYFLGRYVTVLPGVRKIKDGLGLWTGKRQFRVKLNVDTSTEDGYCHPPAVFSIGADRGFLVYAGQPQACRKCGSTGHNADRCEQMRCRSCGKIGHITKDCKEPRKCHLVGYTWKNTRGMESRLDYILIEKKCKIKQGKIIPALFTDHQMIVVDLEIEGIDYGKGYWKLNNEVLMEKEYKERFAELFPLWEEMESLYINKLDWWEDVKNKIKKFTVDYCTERSSVRKEEFRILQKEIEYTYTLQNEKGNNKNMDEKMESLRLKQEELLERKARAETYKIKQEEYEENEKCSAFFFKR